MLFTPMAKDDVDRGFATLQNAAANCPDKQILASEDAVLFPGTNNEMNGCSIQTALIHIIGRYCEHYASDIIAVFNALQPFLESNCPTEDGKWYIGVGIRECGVDGNGFLLSRLRQSMNPNTHLLDPRRDYRKVLCIEITETIHLTSGTATRLIQLKDVTNELTYMADEDLEND